MQDLEPQCKVLNPILSFRTLMHALKHDCKILSSVAVLPGRSECTPHCLVQRSTPLVPRRLHTTGHSDLCNVLLGREHIPSDQCLVLLPGVLLVFQK